MAIRLNFLHELESIKTQRQRDPLKLALLGLILVIILFAGFYMWRSSTLNDLRSSVKRAEAEWAKKGPAQTEAEKSIRELETVIGRVKVLKTYVDDRFFWAPVLALLDRSTPPQVQLTSFNGVATGDGASITFGGVVADQEPRIAADKYKFELGRIFQEHYESATTRFNVLEEQPGTTITLEGEELNTARFSIGLSIKGPRVEIKEQEQEEKN